MAQADGGDDNIADDDVDVTEELPAEAREAPDKAPTPSKKAKSSTAQGNKKKKILEGFFNALFETQFGLFREPVRAYSLLFAAKTYPETDGYGGCLRSFFPTRTFLNAFGLEACTESTSPVTARIRDPSGNLLLKMTHSRSLNEGSLIFRPAIGKKRIFTLGAALSPYLAESQSLELEGAPDVALKGDGYGVSLIAGFNMLANVYSLNNVTYKVFSLTLKEETDSSLDSTRLAIDLGIGIQKFFPRSTNTAWNIFGEFRYGYVIEAYEGKAIAPGEEEQRFDQLKALVGVRFTFTD